MRLFPIAAFIGGKLNELSKYQLTTTNNHDNNLHQDTTTTISTTRDRHDNGYPLPPQQGGLSSILSKSNLTKNVFTSQTATTTAMTKATTTTSTSTTMGAQNF